MSGLHHQRIAASALGYAIAFLLLVGLLTSGLLFVSSAHKRLEQVYSSGEHVLFDHQFALLYAARKKDPGSYVLYHPSGDTSAIRIQTWGVFRACSVRTFHGAIKETHSALIGEGVKRSNTALYLPDNNQSLNVCGSTHLEGELYLPTPGVSTGNLSGFPYLEPTLYTGELHLGKRILPALDPAYSELRFEQIYTESEQTELPDKDSSFSFLNGTQLVMSLNPITVSQRLSGNLVLRSFDSIYVRNTARLEHIILIAPKVRFEAGFRGSVQVFAEQSISCEEDVFLSYPSILVLSDPRSNPKETANIDLRKKATVLGGILLMHTDDQWPQQLQLRMDDALVAGCVYNEGTSQVSGKIAGTLYTQEIFYQDQGNRYTNCLVNAQISPTYLPVSFKGPNWISQTETTTSSLLTWF